MGNSTIKVDAGGFWNNNGSEKDIDVLNDPLPRHMYDKAIEEICKKNNVRKPISKLSRDNSETVT